MAIRIYDQIWYTLPRKQALLFIPLIIDIQHPIGLKSGLEDCTYAYAAKVCKAAYSLALGLEEAMK